MKELRCRVLWAWRRLGVRCSAALIATLTCSSIAHADVRDYVGRTLIDVRVEVGGVSFSDPSVLQLVETRVGQPLSMEQVRETIDHLVGLGRFEDVRVFAEPSTVRPDGIVLRWQLVPVQRIAAITVGREAVFDADVLRSLLSDRFGTSPATSRLNEMIQTLTEYYRGRGYQRPVIEARMRSGEAPELVTVIFAIDPGPRTLIGNTIVRGDAGASADSVIAKLGLGRGRPYDRTTIDTRLVEFEDSLRDLGYYEANVELAVSAVDSGRTADITIQVDRGARARIVFTGDPLPANRRDDLVPIRQERSIDLDLLEDASRNIEGYLREQGYRAAEAPYVREEKAGETVITFTVTRGPLYRLASLDVTGNRGLATAELVPLLALKPGEPFVESRVSRVAGAVIELYRVRGFAQAVVKPEVTLRPSQSDAGPVYRPVAVRLIITEGPPTTVGDVTVDGADQIGQARIRQLLGLAAGKPFYRPQLDVDRSAVERLYQNEGFRDVRVEARTELLNEGQRVGVHWRIDGGQRTLVDHVLVSGNARTSADLIRREVVLQPGGPLGEEALVESQRRLAALGLFRRVRIIELPHGSGSTRDVLIEVEEAPATTVSYGGGVEAGRRVRLGDNRALEERIEVAPRGFFEIGRRNLGGKNRSITLLTRVSFRPRDPAADVIDVADEGGYGFNEYRVVGTFREPRPFNTPGDAQFTIFLEQAIRSSFNFSRRGLRTEYARRLPNALTAGARYSLDRTRLFDEKIEPEDQLLIDRLFPRVRLSTLTGSVLRDSRNDVVDPERGGVLGVDSSLAARRLGSEVGFLKSFLQAFTYRRLPGRPQFILAAGVRVGFAVGFQRSVERRTAAGEVVIGSDGQPVIDIVDDVPASERFFAGGDSTVRGFVLDRLGTDDTRNDQGFPTGGNGLAVINLELRTRYWKGLGGVGFFDAGNVFKSAADVALDELRPAAGFGLRYRSPLGPVRVDLGFNLDRQVLSSGVKERGMVFHISLGQAF